MTVVVVVAVVVDRVDLGTTTSGTGKFSLVVIVEGEEMVVDEEAVVKCLLRLEFVLMELGNRCCGW